MNVAAEEENIDPRNPRYPMFNIGYEEEKKPNFERAKERLKDIKNVESLGQQAILKKSKYFENNPGAKEFFSRDKEQGPGMDDVKKFLGGKSKRTTHKRKYKSKKKNIIRKGKQSRRKGRKTSKK